MDYSNQFDERRENRGAERKELNGKQRQK